MATRPPRRLSIYKDDLAAGRGADIAVKNFAKMMAARGWDVELFDRPRFADAIKRPCDLMVATGTNELVELADAFPESFPWPVVMQLHTHPTLIFKRERFFRPRIRRRNRALRQAFPRLELLQVLLPSQIEAAREVLGRDCPKRIVAIGNSLSIRPPDEIASGTKKTILYPASLEPAKRQDLLIEAFALATRDRPGWKLELYGRGREKHVEALKRLVRKLGLEGKVGFMGFGDLSQAYRDCAFAAQASKIEGFGLTVIEAAAYGKATVGCADATGVNELVVDGETGILSDPSASPLAAALGRLMDDGPLRIRLGAAARAKALKDFSPEAIAGKWDEELCKTIGC